MVARDATASGRESLLPTLAPREWTLILLQDRAPNPGFPQPARLSGSQDPQADRAALLQSPSRRSSSAGPQSPALAAESEDEQAPVWALRLLPWPAQGARGVARGSPFQARSSKGERSQ